MSFKINGRFEIDGTVDTVAVVKLSEAQQAFDEVEKHKFSRSEINVGIKIDFLLFEDSVE